MMLHLNPTENSSIPQTCSNRFQTSRADNASYFPIDKVDGNVMLYLLLTFVAFETFNVQQVFYTLCYISNRLK